MYKDKFVLSIIHDGRPVKEIGHRQNKEVVIPFDSEYKIRLKNKNDRDCTAEVLIDGKKVSSLGDIIISAGGTIDLERYINTSLDKGKKFKFVSLDHADVDDPTSSSNGMIEVTFKKAKCKKGIKINVARPNFYFNYDWAESWKKYSDAYWAKYSDEGSHLSPLYGSSGHVVDCCNDTNNTSSAYISSGATVEGGNSSQQFVYSNLEVENTSTVLKLRIVGVEKQEIVRNTKYKYCINCGSKTKFAARYCFNCGYKIY
jgi:hypothetical protein